MAVDPELLAILACPECKTPVTLVHNGAGLKCRSCAGPTGGLRPPLA